MMTGEANPLGVSALVALLAVESIFGEVVIRQHPRDLPSYPSARQSFEDVKAKVAVCPLPVAGDMLVRALTNGGCRVVSPVPQCGCALADRPDFILEPISLVSNTERDGAAVDLVTVLIVRVRKPVRFGEGAQGRTFQGASRISLGSRIANEKGETWISQEEIASGVRMAVENLLRIPALKAAMRQAG